MILTRRAAMALPCLAASARTATAQPTSSHPTPPSGTSILAADSQPSSLVLAQTLASHLDAGDFAAEASQDLVHSITALTNREKNNLAILPSTVLAFMDSQRLSIVDSMRFIAQVCVMEVHVLVSDRIGSVADLKGRKVNVGPLGSQGQITASLLLERAGLRVEPVHDPDDAALASLIRRQLTGMIFLAYKPSRLLFNVNLADGVHFLPIFEGTSGERPTGGFPAQIDPVDYPLLNGGESGAGQPIPTIAIPLVLACYDWPAVSDQFITFAHAAELLSQRGSGLPGFSMTAPVPGWQRFGPVSDWLKSGGSISAIAVGAQRAATPQAINYHKLYLQFREWQKRHP
jgi:hypothetical protein